MIFSAIKYYLLHISDDRLFSLRYITLVQAAVIAISVTCMASSMPPVVLFGYDCEVNALVSLALELILLGQLLLSRRKSAWFSSSSRSRTVRLHFFHLTMIISDFSYSFHRCLKHDASSSPKGQFPFDVPKDPCPRNWSRGYQGHFSLFTRQCSLFLLRSIVILH